MTDPEESARITLARAGDQAALEALFRTYDVGLRNRIRRRLTPLVLRKASVSDVLQEALLVAHQRIGTFEDRGAGSFGVWLQRIVDLKVRETVRRHTGIRKRDARREVSRGARRATGEFAGRQPTPSQVAIAAELRERIQGALGELPTDYREVIFLVQQEGLTLAEAAARLGRSLGATKMLYGRALARFAALVGVSDRKRT